MAYDKKTLYKKEIAPLIQDLLVACDRYQIPMFATFAIQDNGKDTVYQSEMISSLNAGVALSNDLLPKHVNILNGFDVVPYLDVKTLDLEEHLEAEDFSGMRDALILPDAES